MSNLLKRIISGIVLVAIMLVAIIGREWYAAIILAVFAVIGASELYTLFGKLKFPPLPVILYPLSVVFVLRGVLPEPTTWVDAAVAAALVVGLTSVVTVRSSIVGWVSAIGGAIYVGYTLGYFVMLLDITHRSDTTFGMWLVLIIAGSVIACDMAAYFIGTAIGRHPFMPQLSPKKSQEGAIAGLIGAMVVSGVASPLVLHLAVPASIALGIAIGVAAQIGDLAESALKRQAEVKDSGSLIPGHGGMLDRLDSLVMVAPVVYWYLRLIGVV